LKTQECWRARHEHSALVFQDKLWVLGGYDPEALQNDVWSLAIPPDENMG
jgi:hypothetical protein